MNLINKRKPSNKALTLRPAEVETPMLSSGLARLAVFGIAALSTKIGVDHWCGQDQPALAWLTISAEAAALVGFHVAKHHFDVGDNRRLAYGAAGLTLLAAGWCGLTTYEKLRDDSLIKRQAQLSADVAYQQALTDVATAARRVELIFDEVAPAGIGPQGREVWQAGQDSKISLATQLRTDADARLENATPKADTDWLAIVRGVGVEIFKLFGWVVFAPASAGRIQRRRKENAGHNNTEENVPEIDVTNLGSLAGAALVAQRKDRQSGAKEPAPTQRSTIKIVRHGAAA